MGVYVNENGIAKRKDGAAGPASDVPYNNTESGMEADNVQDALTELNSKIPLNTERSTGQQGAYVDYIVFAGICFFVAHITKPNVSYSVITGLPEPQEEGEQYVGTLSSVGDVVIIKNYNVAIIQVKTTSTFSTVYVMSGAYIIKS